MRKREIEWHEAKEREKEGNKTVSKRERER
jgi:hypothetical protein